MNWSSFRLHPSKRNSHSGHPICGVLLAMGFTYSGHPIVCVATLKNIELMERQKIYTKVCGFVSLRTGADVTGAARRGI